jgi:DNA-binding NarL/FixJ family response regulator
MSDAVRRPTGTQATPYSGVVLVASTDAGMRDLVVRVAHEIGARTRVSDDRAVALALARMDPPDVVVTAVDLGARAAGMTLARACVRQHGSTVVFVGDRLPERSIPTVAALEASFLLTPLSPRQLRATLRLGLMRAEQKIDPPKTEEATEATRVLRQIAAIVASSGLLPGEAQGDVPQAALALLRPREQEVVTWLLRHHRVPEIAERMRLSPNTVRNHLKNAYRRLRVRSQSELLRRLHEMAVAERHGTE